MVRRNALLFLLSLPALGFVALPLLALLLRAEVKGVSTYVACCQQVSSALYLSLLTATSSALVIVLIGTPVAYWLAYGQFPGKRIVDSLVDLPVVLPPAVAGVALLMAFGREGLVGRHLDAMGLGVSFTTIAVVIAQTFVACPFYIRQARIGFQNVPPEFVLASRTLGASPARTFWRVTLPLASHALVAGLIMAWARAMGEFGATLIFAGSLEGVTQTMPLAIYDMLSGKADLAPTLVLSVVLVAVSFVVMVATRLLLGTETRTQERTSLLMA